MSRLRPSLALVVLGAGLLTAACGGGGGGGTTTEPATQPTSTEPAPTTGETTAPTTAQTETTPQETTVVSLYFLRGDKLGVAHREIPKVAGIGAATLEELLSGPTEAEAAAGLHTEVPQGTRLLGLDVQNGLATVDLSGEFDDGGGSLTMFARLAQVVFTLTQFPAVQRVDFRLDGEPVTTFSSEGIELQRPQKRQDFYDQVMPAILVESPAVGDTVTSPLRLSGTANVFEATVSYELDDAAGQKLADGFVTASCGTGCWGTFAKDVSFQASQGSSGTLHVFEVSAKDGSRTKEVVIPLTFG